MRNPQSRIPKPESHHRTSGDLDLDGVEHVRGAGGAGAREEVEGAQGRHPGPGQRGRRDVQAPRRAGVRATLTPNFFFITLGLELSDTKVYEPEIRALLGTASHSCEAVVLESRIVPGGTALGLGNVNSFRRVS